MKKQKLQNHKIYWVCPSCNFFLTNIQYLNVIYDFMCPRCSINYISEFERKII